MDKTKLTEKLRNILRSRRDGRNKTRKKLIEELIMEVENGKK